jgi:hypothetical protein
MNDLTPMDEPTLQVQVEGTETEGMRLYVIARPAAGRVRVREWRGETWAHGPVDREVAAAELLEELERAHRARRRLSEELYRVKLWLEGNGP